MKSADRKRFHHPKAKIGLGFQLSLKDSRDVIDLCHAAYLSPASLTFHVAEFINYCKTWMIVDIVTLAPDWAFTLVRMVNPNLAGAGVGFLGGVKALERTKWG